MGNHAASAFGGAAFRCWRLAFVWLMAAVWACTTLSAQTIENIAQARWMVSGAVVQTQSNRVEVTIAAPAVSLDTFRLAADSTLRVSLADGGCAWPGGSAGTVGIAPAT